MAKQTIRRTKKRVRKTGGNSGYQKCNICHALVVSKKNKK